jgi:cardiolipin synthase
VLGRRGARFHDGNAVELFECGREAFPRMLDAIGRAERFVHLETYILRSDGIGTRFLEALCARAARGVAVRLIYDAVGSLGTLDAGALAALRAAGARVLPFNPLQRFYPEWAPRRRDHRKLLVVDGARGFLGGLNIGDEYAAGPVATEGRAGWRDTHVEVRGPVLRDLGAVFLESWSRAGGEALPWQALLAAPVERPGDATCGVLADGPVYSRRALRDLLVECLDGTRESARLTSPYFWPDRALLRALASTARRGVRVEMIVAGRETDLPALRRASRAALERLLRCGVAIWEYEGGTLHAKSAVFDRDVAIVGSSNLDRQSLEHSYEENLVAVGVSLPGDVDRLFEADLARSRPLTLERLSRRRWWTRAADWLATWLARRLW